MTDRPPLPQPSDRLGSGPGRPLVRRNRRLAIEPLEARALLATFTVSNTNDSDAGSLRQAILDANANPGADRIVFEIGSGLQTISPASELPAITDPVDIDGSTQSSRGRRGSSPMIELDGNLAGPVSSGLTVLPGGRGSRIAGLVINRFGRQGIALHSDENLVEGNLIGTDPTGTMARPNAEGILVTAPGNTIGGSSTSDRNVISGNSGDGVLLNGSGASNTVIRNNHVGVDVSGDQRLGNGSRGIDVVNGASANTIQGNVVAANLGIGIALLDAVDSTVQGNFIGTDRRSATRLGNSGPGIAISSTSANLIGGTGSNDGNVIAFNGGAGISVQDLDREGQSLLRNSIFENGGLGIDLGLRVGPDPNDTGDLDRSQNHPVLTSAISNARGRRAGRSETVIEGTLRSRRNSTYRLEFFASEIEDPTGFGEGQRFLGTLEVTTNVNGEVDFSATLPLGGIDGQFLTATATGPDGDTSEFSAALLIRLASGSDPDPDPDPVPDPDPSRSRAPADFDGDGRTDFATYSLGGRSSGQFELRFASAPDSVGRRISLGNEGDFPVVGDYDGDGLADAAVFGFDPEAGFSTYRIRRSSDGRTITQPFGGPFDFPIAGDYDGDGRTDIAVFGFSPDDGFSRFAVLRSTGGTIVQPFGGPGDFPVSGDYDGDGRDDLAVFGFSPDEGFSRFGIIYSSGRPTLSLPFGGPEDRPLQGDFDGDGRSDVAVFGFSPNEGFARFGVLSSAGGPARSIPFGGADDRPVAGDYDGDGTTDLAVFGFSPNNGFSRFGVVPSGGSPAITREAGSAESIGLPPFSGLFRIQGGSGSGSGTGSASRRAGGLPSLALLATAIDGPTASASASRSARHHWAELVDLALGDDDEGGRLGSALE
jgi:hypothetical protein